MSSIEDLQFGERDSANARNDFTLSVWHVRCGRMFGWLFQTSDEIQYLNAHLRRDAGIDENELEMEAVRRAPLIR